MSGGNAAVDRERGAQSSQKSRRAAVLTAHHPTCLVSGDALVLKNGNLFFLANERGDVPLALPHPYGLFLDDCRYLHGLQLTLNGAALTCLRSIASRGFETRHYLTNPELDSIDDDTTISKNTVAIERHRVVHDGIVRERLCLRLYGRSSLRVRVELRFSAGFEDVFAVKGFKNPPHGSRADEVIAADRVELRYHGTDRVWRVAALLFEPLPAGIDLGSASWDLTLREKSDTVIALAIAAGSPRRATEAVAHAWDGEATARHEREERAWLDGWARPSSSSRIFDERFQRAILDLGMLRSRLGKYEYFAAGVPWFATLFGRDALISALQALPYRSLPARETIELLAEHQAKATEEFRDAEPGKLVHEYRVGELSHLEEVPQSPAYYGSIDAPILFLITLAEYVAWSGDLGLAGRMRPHVDAALGWMCDIADRSDGGYVTYGQPGESPLVNQGWKDSGNAIVNADGSLADPPIALCEVQGYFFRALRQSAALLRALGDAGAAHRLEDRARELRARFEPDFWSDALGCYVMALERDGRSAAVVSSNAGQVLWSGIASAERAAAVVRRLMASDMFCGWRIRTLSTEAAAYNPMGYNIGTIWPHGNSIILSGFRRYGCDAEALRIFDSLLEAAGGFRDGRLPELFCGYDRSSSPDAPVSYPAACSPQAWAAGALPYALSALLGLVPDASARRLRLCRPRLPNRIDRLDLEGLHVGEARVDLHLERRSDEGHLTLRASVRHGDLAVNSSEELPPADEFGIA